MAALALGAVVFGPGVPGSAAPPLPRPRTHADAGTSLAVIPLGDGRSGLFVRDFAAAGQAGPWRQVAIDTQPPYEFHTVTVAGEHRLRSTGEGGPLADQRVQHDKIASPCQGKHRHTTNEDTGVQEVEFRNQPSTGPLKHAGAQIRFKFKEIYCDHNTGGLIDAWLRTERSDQSLFIRGHVLNQDRNADTAVSDLEWQAHGDRKGRWHDPRGWNRPADWGIPYWFKAVMKSLWQEGEPSHTAVGNTTWPPGDELFPVGYRCQPGPDPVPWCEGPGRSRRDQP